MKATAELKMLPVSVLKPAAYNPRKKLKPGDKEYEKIKNSITEFGFADPLVVNADMTIIGGHQRLTVAMALGYTEVPCAVVDIDKTREKALNIALNKITGAWDDSLLADLLKDIENSNFDLGKTGFDPPEIETLFNKVHNKEVKEDDFDVESELKQPCFSKAGDLWMLGKHRVLCGDSTKAECYDTLMDGTKANLVLSDPPYNVDVEETAGKIMNDNMGDSEFYEFLLAAFKQMHGHLADDGSIYIFHADTEGLNFRKAFKDAGFYLSGCCIWKKNALVLGRSPYQWQHEPCLYGWKQKGKHQWYSDRKQTTIWEYDRPKANKDHPTMKPIGLMSYPLCNSTMTNGIVLDPFLGSGSTLIACEETDRVCRGIELDPKFVDVIVKRYIEHSEGRYPSLESAKNDIVAAYLLLEESYKNGGKLLVAGNGGSAADAEHIVGELMKGFKLPRKPETDFAERLVAENHEFGSVLAENLQGALPAIALDGHPALSTAYQVNERINDRGVMIDTELVQQAITCDLMLSDAMSKKAYELTGLENPNSVSQLKTWLEERGIPMDTLPHRRRRPVPLRFVQCSHESFTGCRLV